MSLEKLTKNYLDVLTYITGSCLPLNGGRHLK